ncbi:uncharacterized protein PHACADRAFT_196205 [Phanerochaete carnosa HHB-10118-sp]|uniref:Uncharacterized protein n=1 Tax=Phanerochaete carnosa (strain HHB-10118-sp) TaxID=650164 RepID=K5X057_PHACS|nr:uncharacterized protein PHACADRAFT_196205 [Phanerochaete carnosa HHB-10118-sp]EKM56152.1 hypothetical protein PHACADRAFT_196205 [Phanerochaete carnosa HHB-10118-sp]
MDLKICQSVLSPTTSEPRAFTVHTAVIEMLSQTQAAAKLLTKPVAPSAPICASFRAEAPPQIQAPAKSLVEPTAAPAPVESDCNCAARTLISSENPTYPAALGPTKATWLPKSTYHLHQALLDKEERAYLAAAEATTAKHARDPSESLEPEQPVQGGQASPVKRTRPSPGEDPSEEAEDVDVEMDLLNQLEFRQSLTPEHDRPLTPLLRPSAQPEEHNFSVPPSRPWEESQPEPDDDDEADSASGQPELMLPDARRPDHGSYVDHVLAEEDEEDEEDKPHRPSELNEPVFTMSHRIKDLETAQQFITAL